MTVVLDSYAVLALALTEITRESAIGDAIENEVCYMTPISVAEVYQLVYRYASKQLADMWFEFLTARTGDVHIVPDNDKQFLQLVNDALVFEVPTSVAFSAALARLKGVPVLTNKTSFDELRDAGFCEVRSF